MKESIEEAIEEFLQANSLSYDDLIDYCSKKKQDVISSIVEEDLAIASRVFLLPYARGIQTGEIASSVNYSFMLLISTTRTVARLSRLRQSAFYVVRWWIPSGIVKTRVEHISTDRIRLQITKQRPNIIATHARKV